MKKVIIMGAAGRDFHNFNVFFRNNSDYKVVAFTAAQIPNISGRKYPKELSGKHYPKGIPIYPEESLPKLIKKHDVDVVVLAYSDLPYMHVMHKASLALANGAEFRMLGTKETMLKSRKPVIAVTAVRTGCGKSQTTRRICDILKKKGRKVVVVRHPMPYGDLGKQIVQRFASYKDLDRHNATIEEREEYEPLIDRGLVVYAGVDYEKILRAAEKEADVIVFDGGNNDFPFFKPDLWIVLLDPLRPGHEITYYPGEVNLRRAHIAIINKEGSAKRKDVEIVRTNIKKYNRKAKIIDADSKITVNLPEIVNCMSVIIVEDGPTLTHGGLPHGAGYVIAKKFSCKIIDPRPYAVGSIKRTYKKFPHLGKVLPAMGYDKTQIEELKKTINRAKCDAVIIGTPIDLRRIMKINKPVVRVKYELIELKGPKLGSMLKKF